MKAFQKSQLYRLCKEEKEAVQGCCLEEFRVLLAARMIHCFKLKCIGTGLTDS